MTKQNKDNDQEKKKQPYGKEGFLEEKDDFHKHLSKVFNKYFDKRGKSMTNVASEADVSYTYVSQIKRGVTSPNSFVLGKLAETLRIPAGEIFPGLPSSAQDYVEDYLDVIQSAHNNNVTPEQLDAALQFIKQNRNLKKIK